VVDSGALIEGGSGTFHEGAGVVVGNAAGTVTNFATIQSTQPQADAVLLRDGGSLVNGANGDRGALVEGYYNGVTVKGAAGAITNFGTVEGRSSSGVSLVAGGSVINGSFNDTAALIEGVTGIDLGAAGSVANFGTVNGENGYGAVLRGAATVTNGNGTDRTALIEGYIGLELKGGGTIANFGAIESQAAGAFGAYLGGGSITNGTATDTVAIVEGYNGLGLQGATAINFGTILGQGAAATEGASLGGGSSLTNRVDALVEGYAGVVVAGPRTVTNFGTITGLGGAAATLGATSDVLAVEAGSVFVGAVNGGGGTLDLASGTGTVSLLAGDDAVVSGSMATTTFQNFGTVEGGPGAVFTLTGSDTVVAGQTLVDDGGLSLPGVLTVAGTLTVAGSLGGAGTVAISGGTTNLNAGTNLTVADVTISGAAKVTANASLAYAGKWTQSAGVLTVAAGDAMTFTGPANSFAGSLAGAGTVAFTAGADTLAGTILTAAHVNAAGATVTLSGAIANASVVTVSGGQVVVAAGGAGLTGTGHVLISDSAANRIIGATAAATLSVGQLLEGAGKLGGGLMTLDNLAAGIIESAGANALIIDTGANTITNAGLIEAVGTGGLTINSAINNSGRLYAFSTMTVTGAVTGSGFGEVVNGTLRFAATSTFNQNVTFASGSKGTLELAHGQTYAGRISGLSTTGANFLDLDDIAFGVTTTTKYAGTSAGGVLTVTDGAHTASIKLIGDYTASTFVAATDGHGGTLIHDPAKAPAKAPPASGAPHLEIPLLPTHAFIQAMAGLGARAGESFGQSFDAARAAPPLLARPGTAIA